MNLSKNIKKILLIVFLVTFIAVLMIFYFKKMENKDYKVTQNKDDLENKIDYVVSQNVTNIVFSGNNITVDGEFAIVSENIVKITSAGTYNISGTLDNGCVIVDAGKRDVVNIVLNNVSITCSSSSPIYIKKSGKTEIKLQEGSNNTLVDSKNYVYDDIENEEPNSTIFSKSDLYLSGKGTLNITSNLKNGIKSKDCLHINDVELNIVSSDNGINGKDLVSIKNASIDIECQGDGIKSTNSESSDKGNIQILDSTINIISSQDGINSENNLNISGGKIDIISGEGSKGLTSNNNFPRFNMNYNTSDTISKKGIKSNMDMDIQNSDIRIDSLDDSIHSNSNILISSGNFSISSDDDGIHADNELVINDGNIDILRSYEGIEASNISINGGNIHVLSSDDGINTAGGNDNSLMGGRFGDDKFKSTSNCKLNITGGYIYVNSSGDGLDSNGSIYMSSGTVIIDGPENGGNGALDYDSVFEISGGTLIATGSAGMAMSTSNTSSQNTVMINFDEIIDARKILNIKDSEGKDIITYSPAKKYQNIVISTPLFVKNSTYSINIGGICTGNMVDGLYNGGEYSLGTKYSNDFNITNVLTNIGNKNFNNNSMVGPHRGR